MEFSPSTAQQIEVEKVEAVTDFLFLDSKITADSDCSHEIRSPLLLGRKAMTNLDDVLGSKDTTLPTKVCIVKAVVFPVVTYGYGSWMIKKAECQRIDAFELWCWRRLPKNALESKEIKPVNLKGVFTGKADAEASVFWSSDENRQLTEEVPDAGKD